MTDEEIESKRGTSTCPECKKLYSRGLSLINQRIKAEKSKHTPEELEAIKKKYAGGVPAGEIELWIRGL